MSVPGDPIRLESPIDVAAIATPALLVDQDALDRNLVKMADFATAKSIGLRPHTKTHKSPFLARRQIDLGAVGVCAAKVSEAEVLVSAGIAAVLITSPVVTPEKIERVVSLAAHSDRLQIVVDQADGAGALDQAARARGLTIGVVVDLDPGIRRTGIAPGEPALRLVEAIQEMPGLRFDGLQAYAGHVMHVEGWEARRARSREALAACIETKHLVESAGHEVAIFTGGGTGTFDIDCGSDADRRELTDLQVGSYLFMDVEYQQTGGPDGDVFDAFEPALFVLTTAISQPVAELITVDAGYKSLATDTVKPRLRRHPEITYNWGGDEHGILKLDEPPGLRLGDKCELVVPHCDPTVNLYDYYHPYRDGKVSELWPVSGRGKSQ